MRGSRIGRSAQNHGERAGVVRVARGKALVAKLRAQAGVRDPEALAAYLGRFKKARKAGKSPAEAAKAARDDGPSASTKAKPTAAASSKAGSPQKRVEDALSPLQKQFPMVDIKEIRPIAKGDDISSSAHMGHKSGVVVYNPKKLNAAGLKEVETQQRQGFLVKTPGHSPLEQLVTHEFGHSIGPAILAGASNPDTFEQYKDAQAALYKAMRSDAEGPSKYAKTNRQEAFAEAFADYMLNPPDKHSPHTKEVGRVVEALKKIRT